MNPKTVKFNYTKSRSYKTIYANGAHGGAISKDELHLDLTYERTPQCESETYLLNSDGTQGQRIEQEGVPTEPAFIRERLIGVILTPRAAKSIGKWLIKKADEMMGEEMRISPGEEETSLKIIPMNLN